MSIFAITGKTYTSFCVKCFGWEPFSFMEPNGFGSPNAYGRLSTACPMMDLRRYDHPMR